MNAHIVCIGEGNCKTQRKKPKRKRARFFDSLSALGPDLSIFKSLRSPPVQWPHFEQVKTLIYLILR